jgi:putative peptidoglycan lipid II flippase
MRIRDIISGYCSRIGTLSLVRDSITTTIWNVVGKSVGFLIPFFIAAWFGLTTETDAFFFAYGIIIFIAGVFYPVVEKIMVPFIADSESKGEDTGKFIGGILVSVTVVLFILSSAILLAARPVLSVITRFDTEALNLIIVILLETAPLIIFLTWTSIMGGAINAYKRFVIPAISPAFRAVICLLIIFIFRDLLGVHAIALGYVAGEIFRFLILLIFIYKRRLFKINLSFNISIKTRKFLKVSSYQVLGMLAVGLSPIIDKTMASWLKTGSVSILEYANRLYTIPLTFLSAGLMVVLLSHWSERYYKEGKQKLKENVKKTIKVVTIIAIIITFIMIILNRVIVSVAYGRGEFDMEKLPEIGRVFAFYMAGFIPYMAGRIFVLSHLILKNTRDLLKCGFYTGLLNILFNYILMRIFDVAGIALATSLVSIFSLCYLGFVFYKKLGKEG